MHETVRVKFECLNFELELGGRQLVGDCHGALESTDATGARILPAFANLRPRDRVSNALLAVKSFRNGSKLGVIEFEIFKPQCCYRIM